MSGRRRCLGAANNTARLSTVTVGVDSGAEVTVFASGTASEKEVAKSRVTAQANQWREEEEGRAGLSGFI